MGEGLEPALHIIRVGDTATIIFHMYSGWVTQLRSYFICTQRAPTRISFSLCVSNSFASFDDLRCDNYNTQSEEEKALVLSNNIQPLSTNNVVVNLFQDLD